MKPAARQRLAVGAHELLRLPIQAQQIGARLLCIRPASDHIEEFQGRDGVGDHAIDGAVGHARAQRVQALQQRLLDASLLDQLSQGVFELQTAQLGDREVERGVPILRIGEIGERVPSDLHDARVEPAGLG